MNNIFKDKFNSLRKGGFDILLKKDLSPISKASAIINLSESLISEIWSLIEEYIPDLIEKEEAFKEESQERFSIFTSKIRLIEYEIPQFKPSISIFRMEKSWVTYIRDMKDFLEKFVED